ncbi:MAG: hypothetical protein J1F09_09730 [Oscillospiraceae bacterium]|nr:hypothetical protein [Oscillospiraceae bacterium]
MRINNDLQFNINQNNIFSDSDFGEFQSFVESAVAERVSPCGHNSEGLVIVSPKLEEKMQQDPELYEELRQQIEQAQKSKDYITIFDKTGERTVYCTKNDRQEHPTAEELKEVAKARARRKARLDAYFHLLERVSLKRKLIEQENAKRAVNKKYHCSLSRINCIVRSRQLTDPPKNPDYYF